MANTNDGRRVKWFCFEQGGSLNPDPGEEFIFVSEFPGEYDQCWITCIRGETEIRRWNARYVASIEWAGEGPVLEPPR